MKVLQRTRTNTRMFLIGIMLGLTCIYTLTTLAGCSTIAGGVSGVVHGLADDMDSLTDKMSKDKQDRQRLQEDRYE